MKSNFTYSTSKGVGYGMLGGIIGAIIMGGIASMMPVNGVPFFVAAGMMMGVNGNLATTAGWMLHIITGAIVGAIFGAVVTRISKLRASSIGRGLGLGALAGIIAWIVLFVPLASALASSMNMTLMSMGTIMVVGSFAAHIIFGLILGGTVGVLLNRSGSKQYTCKTCGASFASQSELMSHGKIHMKPEAQGFKCAACGASFNSQQELMEHSKKAHPMPAR
jgi:DNA-directed RNA polymerase subunit RPC12/RpoP